MNSVSHWSTLVFQTITIKHKHDAIKQQSVHHRLQLCNFLSATRQAVQIKHSVHCRQTVLNRCQLDWTVPHITSKWLHSNDSMMNIACTNLLPFCRFCHLTQQVINERNYTHINVTYAPLPQPKTWIQPLIIGQHTIQLPKHMQTPLCNINGPKIINQIPDNNNKYLHLNSPE